MNLNKKIGVIIPVYNVENLLKKCVDSVVNQSYKNFTIYLVDDGSTDNSGKICDEYKEKYDFIQVFHKENGGLSDARNYALDRIDTEYVIFIDSDDYIAKNYIEELYTAAEKYNADLVISNSKSVYNYSEGNEQEKINSNGIIELSKEEAFRRILLQQDCDVSATSKIYKREIFQSIRYPVNELYEDILIIDKIIEKAQKIVLNKYAGYFYYQRQGSIMYGSMSAKRKILENVCDNILTIVKKDYPSIVDAAIWRYVYCNFYLLGRSVLDDEYISYSKHLRDNILKYKDEIKRSPLYSKKQRFATICLQLGLPFYKIMWKLFCLVKGKRIG